MGNVLPMGAARDMFPVANDLYSSINPMTFKDPTKRSISRKDDPPARNWILGRPQVEDKYRKSHEAE